MFGKKQEAAQGSDYTLKKYILTRTVFGILLLVLVIVSVLAITAHTRLRLSREEIYNTNRVRIQTVMNGLQSSVTEKDELYAEYDNLIIAKLKGASYLYGDFDRPEGLEATVDSIAATMGIDAVAVIDAAGNTYAGYNSGYDFTLRRFAMLRACANADGTSTPFSIAYPDQTVRFFGLKVPGDRILVFAQDWTETEAEISGMTSWEAVLRGMVGVDTLSIAVSLKDYTFLYNPIDDLTGRDAIQHGVPIEALTNFYEGEFNFGGDTYCVVGRQWNDAMIYVMTKETTGLANDTVLLVFLGAVFTLFIVLLSAYGIIINQDNLKNEDTG